MKPITFFIIILSLSILNIQNLFSASPKQKPKPNWVENVSKIDWIPAEITHFFAKEAPYTFYELSAVIKKNPKFADRMMRLSHDDYATLEELLKIFTNPKTNDLYNRFKEYIIAKVSPPEWLNQYGENLDSYLKALSIVLAHSTTPLEDLTKLRQKSYRKSFLDYDNPNMTPVDKAMKRFAEDYESYLVYKKAHEAPSRATASEHQMGLPEFSIQSFEEWQKEHRGATR